MDSEPKGLLLQPLQPCTQRAKLCALASWEEAANLQIPVHTRWLSSAHKLLLIKPVPLITGRTIKYVSRCFRMQPVSLVKAGEASDQGCWPCGTQHGRVVPSRLDAQSPSTAQSARIHLFCRLVKAQSIITKVKKTSL